ncbi:hypothetical protein RN001_001851 [Aquatica leii]|uniref:Fanconi-associated nuclease n=1 Tax=Aquatica leii TaxID=1421715 RepID=A0AAN7PCF8_9COLE|nr:hypothetical protein RN001_001851 [Aquatica leii]
MPKIRQTYIDNYFKCGLKPKFKEHSTVNQDMSKMSNISFNEIDTLKRMKQVINEPNFNSIKLPFVLPHYKRDSDKTTNSAGTSQKHLLIKSRNEDSETYKKKRKKKSDGPIGKSSSSCEKKVTPAKKHTKSFSKKMTSPVRKAVSTFIGVYSPNKNVDLDKTMLRDDEYISTDLINDLNINKTSNKVTILSNTPLVRIDQVSINMITSTKKKVSENTNKPGTDTGLNASAKKVEDTNKEERNPWVLDFVRNILKYVAGHASLKKLLTCKETTILNRFLKLPRNEYIFICIKLHLRTKTWYNVFKFSTSVKLKLCDREVMDMYKCLIDEGFVDSDYSSDSVDSLLNHLLLSDVKDLCAGFKLSISPRATKSMMIEKLIANCGKQSTLTSRKSTRDILLERITEKMGHCFRINTDFNNILHKVHLLYKFVNDDFQKVNDLYFFLSKTRDGTIIMPQITVNEDYEIFSSITCFSRFQQAYELKEEVLAAIETKSIDRLYELCATAYEELKLVVESNITEDKPVCIQRFTPGYQYTKALSTGLRHLTKRYSVIVAEWLQFLLKKSKYCKNAMGFWYNTLIKVQFTHIKQYEAATSSLLEALQDKNLSNVDITELNVRAEVIKKSHRHKVSQLQFGQISSLQPILMEDFPCIEIDAMAIRSDVPGKKRNYYEKTEAGLEHFHVEQLALKHYFKNGFTNGLHCEGTLVVSIFFTLFWDIIYGDKVPYAFVNQIQYYPLDLMYKEFYVNRQEAIRKRLTEIECNWSLTELSDHVCTTWTNHYREKSFINAEIVDEPTHLFDILLCIGRLKLRKIMEHLVTDFKTYHSGLPDLFLWNVCDKKCKFVEVKGENDKLSAKQKCWLDFLRSINADIEVCHVHSMGSKRKARNIKTEKDPMKSQK